MDKKISVIINVTDLSNLDKTLESIEKQKVDNVELIIETENNEEIDNIIDKYKCSGIKIIVRKNALSFANKFNDGFDAATGDIITFITSDCYYNSDKIFKKILKKIDKVAIISIRSIYADIQDGISTDYKMQPTNSCFIDLNSDPYLLSLNLSSFFIKKENIGNITFDDLFNDEFAIKFLLDLLYKNNTYYYCNKYSICYLKPLEDNHSKSSIQYNKTWYVDSLQKFYNYYKSLSTIPLYMQEVLMYIIFSKINSNIYDRNKNVISNELDLFVSIVSQCLLFIDDKIIVQNEAPVDKSCHLFSIPRWIKFWLLENKVSLLRSKCDYEINNDKIIIKYKDKEKEKCIENSDVEGELLKIEAINYKDNNLIFDCETSLSDILPSDKIEIECMYGNEKIDVIKTNVYPLLKAFGKTLRRKYPFQVIIPVKNVDKRELKFYAKMGDKKIGLLFDYQKVHARLSTSNKSFWHYNNFVLDQSYQNPF